MKKTLSVIGLMAIMAFAGQAQAHTFSISPTGSWDGTGLTQITYDVTLNADSAFNAIAWDLDFYFDSSELDYVSSTLSAGTVAETTDNLYLNYLDLAGSTAFSAGSNTFASFTFDLLTPLQSPYDGSADFAALSSIGMEGDRGILLDDFVTVEEFARAEGADVGAPAAPVPIPGAVWLLGSGLVGLVGIKRRKADI